MLLVNDNVTVAAAVGLCEHASGDFDGVPVTTPSSLSPPAGKVYLDANLESQEVWSSLWVW